MEEKELIEEIEKSSEFKQMIEKARTYTKEEWEEINEKQLDIILLFVLAKRNGETPSDANTQKAVALLIDYISTFYYDCNTKSLRGMAKMFELETDFRTMVESVEEGGAKFIAEAINYYCDTH